MDWCDVDFWIRNTILQADPVAAVIAPRLVDDCRQAMKVEGYPVVFEPCATYIGHARNGAKQTNERPEYQPAARDLETDQVSVVSNAGEGIQRLTP